MCKEKLNSYGYLVRHCGVDNSAENMKRMKEQLVMANLVAKIHQKEAADKVVEKLERNEIKDENAPAAVWKLEDKGRKVMKLTVAEIELVLLFSVDNITMDGFKLRKADYVGAFKKDMSTNILKYESFVCNIETIPVNEATVIVAGECCA
jgi:hypothetical protein